MVHGQEDRFSKYISAGDSKQPQYKPYNYLGHEHPLRAKVSTKVGAEPIVTQFD